MRIGVAQRSCPGETVCGDAQSVTVCGNGADADGSVLLVVFDGLGHGPDAHEAATAAKEVIEQNPELDLIRLIDRLHARLRRTRGGCVGLARVFPTARRLLWCGVGNIQLYADGPTRVSAVSTPGIVGAHFRKPKVLDAPVAPGTRLAIFSDGISQRLDLNRYRRFSPQQSAEAILEDYGSDHDAATCLVVDVE